MKTIAEGISGDNNFMLMRLVAALLVVYGHCYPIMGSGHPDIILQFLHMQYAGGVAVDIFFIISGFLVARSFEQRSLREFAIARLLRIYPALIVCVFLIIFVLAWAASGKLTFVQDVKTWQYFVNNSLLIRTEYFLPDVFQTNPDKAINGSLWSIYVEIRLYGFLLVVGLLGFLDKRKFFWFCCALLLSAFYLLVYFPSAYFLGGLCFLAACVWLMNSHSNKNRTVLHLIVVFATLILLRPLLSQVSLHEKDWMRVILFFMAGMFCWVYRSEIRLSYPILALLIVFCIFAYDMPQMKFAYFITLVYLVFLVAFCVRLPIIKSIDISYGLYLYAWPMQQFVAMMFPTISPLKNALYSLCLIIPLAYLSWFLVEKPAMNLKLVFLQKRDAKSV